jgi:hypothetical protein
MSWAVWMFVAMFALREPPPRDKLPMMVAITVAAIALYTIHSVKQRYRHNL